jgi:hypothetical protein
MGSYFQCRFTIFVGINFPYGLWTNQCRHCETLNFDCGIKTVRSINNTHLSLPLRMKGSNGTIAIRQRSYAVSLYREEHYGREVYDTFEFSPSRSVNFMPWIHSIVDFICDKEGLAENLPQYLDKYMAMLELNFNRGSDGNKFALRISFV